MAVYIEELSKLVSDGLNELAEAIRSGKTPNNPVSETHFLSAWVTKAIKQQRYDHSVATTLVSWQKQARSQGTKAQMKQQFQQIQATYAGVPRQKGDEAEQAVEEKAADITRSQLTGLYASLTEKDWLVTTGYEVNRKVTHHTDGQASLVVCATQSKLAFDGDTADSLMVKPLSLFVRGDVRELVEVAYQHGLLLFKVTDYKSIVKYHGEYILYPRNAGPSIPEIPVQHQ